MTQGVMKNFLLSRSSQPLAVGLVVNLLGDSQLTAMEEQLRQQLLLHGAVGGGRALEGASPPWHPGP